MDQAGARHLISTNCQTDISTQRNMNLGDLRHDRGGQCHPRAWTGALV